MENSLLKSVIIDIYKRLNYMDGSGVIWDRVENQQRICYSILPIMIENFFLEES